LSNNGREVSPIFAKQVSCQALIYLCLAWNFVPLTVVCDLCHPGNNGISKKRHALQDPVLVEAYEMVQTHPRKSRAQGSTRANQKMEARIITYVTRIGGPVELWGVVVPGRSVQWFSTEREAREVAFAYAK
jgi:hypothetical protein